MNPQRRSAAAVVIRGITALLITVVGTMIGIRGPQELNGSGLVWFDGGLRQAYYWDAVESRFGVALGLSCLGVWVMAIAATLLITFLTRTRNVSLRATGIALACLSTIIVVICGVMWVYVLAQPYVHPAP